MSEDLRFTLLGGLVALLGLAFITTLGTDDFTGDRTAAFWAGIVLVVAGAITALVGAMRLAQHNRA